MEFPNFLQVFSSWKTTQQSVGKGPSERRLGSTSGSQKALVQGQVEGGRCQKAGKKEQNQRRFIALECVLGEVGGPRKGQMERQGITLYRALISNLPGGPLKT